MKRSYLFYFSFIILIYVMIYLLFNPQHFYKATSKNIMYNYLSLSERQFEEITFGYNLKETDVQETDMPKTRLSDQKLCNNQSKDKAEMHYLNMSIYNLSAHDLYRMPVPTYLPGLKTPCFFMEDDGSHVHSQGAVRISDHLVMRCLPHLYLIGVEKSGTSEFYYHVKVHRHILVPMSVNEPVKEPLFLNGAVGRLPPKMTFGDYLQLMNNATRTIYENCMQGQNAISLNGYKECPYVLIDFSARTMNHNFKWYTEYDNHNLTVPKILVPHKLYRLHPGAKILVLLRNPVTRLYSDYRFYHMMHKGFNSPEDFHTRVEQAIRKWLQCISELSLPLDRCAYGNYWPPGYVNEGFWSFNSSDRLRYSIYFASLVDWYKVFPRNNIKVIQMELYVSHTIDILRKLLSFMELDDFTDNEIGLLKNIDNNSGKKDRAPSESMLDKTKVMLEEFYKPYNKQLAELVGDNSFLWED